MKTIRDSNKTYAVWFCCCPLCLLLPCDLWQSEIAVYCILTNRKKLIEGKNQFWREKTTGIFKKTYLKKSFRQYSFPSLEKHLSLSAEPQSEHCTHCTCQARSRTFSRYRSMMGPWHPAHSCIVLSSFSIATLTEFCEIQIFSNTPQTL